MYIYFISSLVVGPPTQFDFFVFIILQSPLLAYIFIYRVTESPLEWRRFPTDLFVFATNCTVCITCTIYSFTSLSACIRGDFVVVCFYYFFYIILFSYKKKRISRVFFCFFVIFNDRCRQWGKNVCWYVIRKTIVAVDYFKTPSESNQYFPSVFVILRHSFYFAS